MLSPGFWLIVTEVVPSEVETIEQLKARNGLSPVTDIPLTYKRKRD